MKQTAVEFLLKSLAEKFENEMQSIYSKDMNLVARICIEAKEMEKQEIINAFMVGDGDAYHLGEVREYAEQYYNETYKQ